MKDFPDLKMRKFDRIIYNFPHAGFHGRENEVRMIKMHKNLVQGFFRNASRMLRPSGEVHINHKRAPIYEDWNLKDLARKHNLTLIKRVEFKQEDYPGYKNKRGSGRECNKPFHLGKCSTFKFKFKKSAQPQVQNPYRFESSNLTALPQNQGVRRRTQNPTPHNVYNPAGLRFRQLPSQPQNRVLSDVGFPLAEVNMPSNLRYFGSPYAPKISDECYRIFHGYFADTEKTFGRRDSHVGWGVHASLRTGSDRYRIEAKERNPTGYIMHLEELHHFSVSRSEWLKRMLYYVDMPRMC